MANITNVVNVQLLAEGQLAQAVNMNAVAIFTSELSFLSSNKRTAIYTDISSVESDFGTYSKAYEYAKTFFSQSPNPVTANGYLVLAYWRATDETVDATSGTLTGSQLSESEVVGVLQQVTDGTFNITVDGGTEQELTGIDFSSVSTLADIVTILDSEITGATVTEDDQKIVITSDTTGVTSTITLLTDGGSGTYIGSTLLLEAGTGAVVVEGLESTLIVAESKEEAVAECIAESPFKGFMFIDNPTDIESKALAEYAQSNDVLSYDVFDSANNLEKLSSNVVWDIKLSSLTNYRMLFSKTGNRKQAVAYMARTHVVNLTAENTTLSMHLKVLTGVASESFSQSEITKAKNVGLDIYTAIKDVPVVLTSGANDFVDNRYNLIALVDSVQVDTFNLLKATATKIPQTQRGVNQLVDTVEKTLRGFVRNGMLGAGTWTSPDFFGDIEVLKRNIEINGFYVMANRLSDQSQADRQARKSPVIQTAIKNAGSINSVDIIINFNI